MCSFVFFFSFLAFDNTKLFGSINTGLSQSDLSIGSQGSVQNPHYRYGNQLEYETDLYGRQLYGVGSTTTFKPPLEPSTSSASGTATTKWVEFDKSPDTDKDNVSMIYLCIKLLGKIVSKVGEGEGGGQ